MINNLNRITYINSNATTAPTVEPKKDGFLEKFLNTTLQPQIFTMLLITLILVVSAVVVYKRVKKQEINKAPEGLLLFAEQYIMGVDNLFKEVTDGKIKKPAPYIFTLLSFLLLGNIMGILGLEAPTSSFSVTLTLGLISWIGIYVVGIIYQKMNFFKKFLNPTEIIGQFSPLISISFRIFGNMIGGSTIMYLIYHVSGIIWGKIPVIGELNLLGPIISPWFHLYFDIFDSLIQAFVFTLLTMIYWTLEAEAPEVEVEKKKSKEITQKIKVTKLQTTK